MLLRNISWCCAFGALICIVSQFYYKPWLFIGVAAAFASLIVRIVKNIVEKAVILKEENDLTV
jgi:hypothetical protein